jgi:hypothetical protein
MATPTLPMKRKVISLDSDSDDQDNGNLSTTKKLRLTCQGNVLKVCEQQLLTYCLY